MTEQLTCVSSTLIVSRLSHRSAFLLFVFAPSLLLKMAGCRVFLLNAVKVRFDLISSWLIIVLTVPCPCATRCSCAWRRVPMLGLGTSLRCGDNDAYEPSIMWRERGVPGWPSAVSFGLEAAHVRALSSVPRRSLSTRPRAFAQHDGAITKRRASGWDTKGGSTVDCGWYSAKRQGGLKGPAFRLSGFVLDPRSRQYSVVCCIWRVCAYSLSLAPVFFCLP
jgi:hypothetical protein